MQLLFHPLLPATVKAINQNQMRGQTPDPRLIQDPDMRHLVEKFNLRRRCLATRPLAKLKPTSRSAMC